MSMPIKVSGYDESDGSFFTFEFTASIVSVVREPGKITITFSNGCVLVQRRIETIRLDRVAPAGAEA